MAPVDRDDQEGAAECQRHPRHDSPEPHQALRADFQHGQLDPSEQDQEKTDLGNPTPA